MSQNTKLIDLTVDLFLYDLRDAFGESDDKIDENRKQFWHHVYNDNLTEQKLEQLKSIEEETFPNYIELLGEQRIEEFKYPLNGYYYPVRLGDTYGLQIDCSGKRNDVDWEQLPQLKQLQQIKEIVLDHTHDSPGKLGQTWLIWGKLATPEQDPEEVAQIYYKSADIIPKSNWKRDLNGQGKIKGATLFELEKPDITIDNVNNNHHLIICFFDTNQTEPQINKTTGQLYRDLMRLFHYRNKIIWVYEQSRQVKKTLKQTATTIQKIINSLSSRIGENNLNLNQLQEDLANALSVSYYYETRLGLLREQQSTIEINLKNYQERVQIMTERDASTNLDFMAKFTDEATYKLNQIKTDYHSLNSGLKPLENFIKTVEGIIAIEKTKNERTLNKTVAIASVGISTASLAASTFSFDQAKGIVQSKLPVPANQPTPPINLWLSFGLAFLLSLVIGVLSAAITGLILNKKTR
jgi:hypothetical protein